MEAPLYDFTMIGEFASPDDPLLTTVAPSSIDLDSILSVPIDTGDIVCGINDSSLGLTMGLANKPRSVPQCKSMVAKRPTLLPPPVATTTTTTNDDTMQLAVARDQDAQTMQQLTQHSQMLAMLGSSAVAQTKQMQSMMQQIEVAGAAILSLHRSTQDQIKSTQDQIKRLSDTIDQVRAEQKDQTRTSYAPVVRQLAALLFITFENRFECIGELAEDENETDANGHVTKNVIINATSLRALINVLANDRLGTETINSALMELGMSKLTRGQIPSEYVEASRFYRKLSKKQFQNGDSKFDKPLPQSFRGSTFIVNQRLFTANLEKCCKSFTEDELVDGELRHWTRQGVTKLAIRALKKELAVHIRNVEECDEEEEEEVVAGVVTSEYTASQLRACKRPAQGPSIVLPTDDGDDDDDDCDKPTPATRPSPVKTRSSTKRSRSEMANDRPHKRSRREC